METEDFRRIGIAGCGQMGAGIAEVTAFAGYPSCVVEVSRDRLDQGLQGIRKRLQKRVEKGKIDASSMEAALGRIQGGVELEMFSDCDLVIEAVVEKQQVKEELFSRINEICPVETLLATNTSSISVTELMPASGRPESFLGLHFFNPVPVMPLVEIVESLTVSNRVVERAEDFVRKLGKEPVRCQDRAGFLVNRLLIPYLLDAVRAFENGTGGREDIDQAMKLGCAHPMGPFELIDFIGIDTVLNIAEVLFQEFREPRFAPPPTLRRMVAAGRLGRKSGQGFYPYTEQS